MIRGKLAAKRPPDILREAPFDLIRRIDRGLDYSHLTDLQSVIRIPASRLAEVAGIAPRTLIRRRENGRFTPAESERLLRLSRIIQLSLNFFENDAEQAQKWLNAPRSALGGTSPLECTRTEIGAREVENLIGRLEQGIFS